MANKELFKNIFSGIFGGLSNSKWSGYEGSFYRSVGIDAHSTPGILKIQQKLAKISSTTIDSFCKVRIGASDGSTLWFSETTGKIWREDSGSVTLVHTTTPAAGNAGCLGAFEYDGYIYWATSARLHRKTITDLSDWTGGVTEDWATFTNANTSYHLMTVVSKKLFIGDGNLLAMVEDDSGHVFTANKLDLDAEYIITALDRYDIDVVIGTKINDKVSRCKVIRFDTVGSSWTSEDEIPENGVNSFIRRDNDLFLQAGDTGRIFFYNGSKAVRHSRMPGDWDHEKKAVIYPHSSAMFKGVPVIGVSNISDTPASNEPLLLGVYSLGSYSRDYQDVLDLSFPISTGNTTGNIKIGGILVKGNYILVAWQDGSTYGLDRIDYSNKYTSAYMETMILSEGAERVNKKTLSELIANYVSLPADCNVKFKYKSKHDAAYSTSYLTTVDDTDRNQLRLDSNSIAEVMALQLKIEFTVKVNNAPEVESILYKLE
ncbi:MAG: hypothetical protein U9R08_02870 [Nanoarchaeota archaeon]|nr:hypothetical protein [Nanoarchaeota archaeon]